MKKGILSKKIEWVKHLRPYGKKLQWGKERWAEKDDVAQRFQEVDPRPIDIKGERIWREVWDIHQIHNLNNHD